MIGEDLDVLKVPHEITKIPTSELTAKEKIVLAFIHLNGRDGYYGGASYINEYLGIPKATAYRIVNKLESNGYIEDISSKVYKLCKNYGAITRDYVLIPGEILFEDRINDLDRLVYGVIFGFRHKKNIRNSQLNYSCNMKFKTMGNLLGVGESAIKNSVSRLRKVGLIETETVRRRTSMGAIESKTILWAVEWVEI